MTDPNGKPLPPFCPTCGKSECNQWDSAHARAVLDSADVRRWAADIERKRLA